MRFLQFGFITAAIVSLGIFVSLNLNIPDSSAAFGVSPSQIKNDHMLPGTTFRKTINLIRTDLSRDARAQIRLEEKLASKWIKIENEKDMIIKKGQKMIPMNVIIKIPKRAEIQRYKTGIFVEFEDIVTEASGGGAMGASIALGGHILVDITVVGDKVIDYAINYVKTTHWNQGEPTSLEVYIKNTGNTSITRLNGQMDIYNYQETEIIKSLTFGQLTEKVSPDSSVASKIEFDDLGLEPGRYWVKVKIFKEGDVIYDTRFSQKVLEPVLEVPVITSEDVEVRKPSIPRTSAEAVDVEPDAVVVEGEDVRQVAPVVVTAESDNKIYFVFGLAGFGFGIIVLVAVIILLVVLLKRQHEATIQHYLAHSHYKKTNRQ